MANLNNLDQEMAKEHQADKPATGVVTVEHRNAFLHSIGSHLQEISPKYGSISFNFKDGKYINANVIESIR